MTHRDDAGYRSGPRDHTGALPSHRNHFGHIAIDLLRQLAAGNGTEALHEIALIRRAHDVSARNEDLLDACERLIRDGHVRDAERLIDGLSFDRSSSAVSSVYRGSQKMGAGS